MKLKRFEEDVYYRPSGEEMRLIASGWNAGGLAMQGRGAALYSYRQSNCLFRQRFKRVVRRAARRAALRRRGRITHK